FRRVLFRSSGALTDNNFNTPFINNRFADNRYGLTVAWGSYLIAGIEPADRSEYTGHRNSIWGNSSKDAYAYQNGTILAQQNWWGSDGAQILTTSGGYIDASHPLTSDPWSGIPLKSSGQNVTNENLEKDSTNIYDIIAGIRLEANGNIYGAIDHYKNMFRELSHPRFALSRLATIKNRFSINSIQNYLANQLTNNQNYKAELLNIIAGMYLDEGRYEEAMQLYNLIITGYPNSYFATNALFEKFFAAMHHANDLTLASQILSQLQSLNITNEDFLMRLE